MVLTTFVPESLLVFVISGKVLSISSRELFHLVFVCHPLDDKHKLFLVVAFFKTARFVFTLDLDFGGDGEDDGETEKLIISLDLKGVIQFTNFPKSHSSELKSLSVLPSSGKRTSLPPSPPLSSQSLSSDLRINSTHRS